MEKLNKKIEPALGFKIKKVRIIGKRMGYRRDPDGHEWQLLMHDVFAEVYTGDPHLTGIIHKETGMPKYTELIFADPNDF